MKELSEVVAGTKELEIVHLPASRIIGKEIRNGGKLGNTAPSLWDEVFASGSNKELEKLPFIYSKDLFGWTCEFDPETKTFIYLVCALTPKGTEVPEGYVYRDIEETLCAVGLYGESVNKTLKRAGEVGYSDNWGEKGCGWNAEMYFDSEEKNPPKKTTSPWHWLVPVKKV